MTSGNFSVPTSDEIGDVLGIWPELAGGPEDVDVHSIRFVDPDGRQESLDLVYDVPGASIRCIWRHGDHTVVDIFREGATRLIPFFRAGIAGVEVEFETDSLRGRLVITGAPRVSIQDKMLLW